MVYVCLSKMQLTIGKKMFYSEGAKLVHNRTRSDLRSLLCLLCCTRHAKAIGGSGACPQEKF